MLLFVFWAILFVGKLVVSGLIHILLIVAIILLIVRLFTRRRTPAV